MLEQAECGVGQASPTGAWQLLNDRFCEIVGHSREELLACSDRDITHPDDRGASEEVVRRVVAGEISSSTLEKRYVRRDRSVVWARVCVSLVRDRDNLPQCFVFMIEDIVDKKQVERALDGSERRLELALDAAGIGFWERDLRTGVTVISGEYARLHALPPDHSPLTHEDWLQLVHPDDRYRVDQQYRESLEQTHFWDTEFRLLWPDGSVHWSLAKGQVFLNDEGRPIRLAGISIEVTERKRVEDQRSRLASIVESSEDAIFSKNLDGTIVSWNAGAEKLFGYTAQEIIGKSMSLLLPPEHRHEFPQILGRIQSGARLEHYEVNRMRKDGSRVEVSVTISPLKDSGGILVGTSTIAHDITQRKQAEEALRMSQQRLELAQEAAGVATWDWDIGANQKHCSKEYGRLYGLPQGDLGPLPEEWLQLVHPEDRGRIREELNRALDGTGHYNTEFRVVWPDGTIHWLLGKGEVFRDSNGKPIRMLGVNMDISERKYAEQALRESEERFRTMADTAPVMIWISGPDKLCNFFNKAWLAFTGRAMEQECGNSWAEGVHPEDLDRCFASYRASFDAREPFQIEYRLRRGDGQYRWVLDNGVPRFESGGVFAGYIGSCIDITDVKRAEQELALNQALRESEEKYHSIVETMTEGVWILDRDDRTTFVNQQMAAMLGYSVEQMVGRHVLDFKDEEARPIALQRLERRRQGITEQYDSTFQTSDGCRLTVLISTRPLWDGDGRYAGTLGIITDITERSLLEERLHRANKMEAIGRLAGGVAHDFNNLLTVINGYSDLLLQNLNAGDRVHAQLTNIRSAGQRAQELTTQILAFSRNQMRATDTLNLRNVIEDVEEMLRRMIGEDIELLTTFDPELGNIRADRTEIIQVLLNLAVNARDAMPTGGRLTFALANVEVDEKDVRTHPGSRPGAHVLLTVTDTGFGMDAEIQKHLFEPFFTTKQVGKGTGLGLATVYGIVSQSNGWIQVDSKPRQGTTFRIYWPLVAGVFPKEVVGVPPKEKDHTGLPDQPLFGTETVLVVEDQAQVREMTCSILKQFGYQVLEASSGEEALCLAEAHTGPLHLLLTDVVMPGMNGMELATRLKTMRPTPILFMSGYSDRTEAVHDSGVTYIQKPFTSDTLVRKVREILGGRQFHAVGRGTG
jgi:PAS domain S-box-containing protein